MLWMPGLLTLAGMVVMEYQPLMPVSLRAQIQSDQTVGEWHSDFRSARIEAAATGLPVVLHFSAEWCSACGRMKHEVLETEQVISMLGRQFVGIQIDVDRNPRLASTWKITTLPTVVFLRADGVPVARTEGYASDRDWRMRLAGFKVLAPAHLVDEVCRGPAEAALEDRVHHQTSGDGSTACALRWNGKTLVGLGGYSPVSFVRDREWKCGDPQYAYVYERVEYHLADAEQLELFRSSPDRFSPVLHGCDPVASGEHTALPGKMQFGAFFKGKAWFFASRISRDLFKSDPGGFANGLDIDPATVMLLPPTP